ncbi:phosphatidylinositol 4-kinase gamma 4-like, partial [Trifolium medium]|nr:phosphatidylinositol 4-kinase gamma 4-like [Trifolium medium]
MLDSTGQKYVSVFKPIDEEPMAVNNPRGLPLSLDGEGLKKGTRVGQGAFREVAA